MSPVRLGLLFILLYWDVRVPYAFAFSLSHSSWPLANLPDNAYRNDKSKFAERCSLALSPGMRHSQLDFPGPLQIVGCDELGRGPCSPLSFV